MLDVWVITKLLATGDFDETFRRLLGGYGGSMADVRDGVLLMLGQRSLGERDFGFDPCDRLIGRDVYIGNPACESFDRDL